MMLCDQAIGAEQKPLFRLGIFFNCVMLFSPSEELGENITDRLKSAAANYSGYMHNLPGETTGATGEIKPEHVFAFSPNKPTPQITVPTLHIIGSQDVFADCSQELTKMCEPGTAEVLVHDGGHALPSTDAMLDRCGEMFEQVVSLASVG